MDIYGPSLSQDDRVSEDVQRFDVSENQGVREGLLQEEWTPNAVRLRCGDGLCAGICSQVIQPVHTGMGWMDEWMNERMEIQLEKVR